MSKLTNWIDSHRTAERTIDNGNGTLTVASWMIRTNLPASHPDRAFIERQVIPATLQAARDWLGY